MGAKTSIATLLATTALTVHAASLADVCTTSYVAAHLPASGYYDDYALTVDTSSVTANPVYNYSVGAVYSNFFPAATFDYCNVTFTYSHDSRDDSVLLTLWLPAPDKFQNRWLSTGGGKSMKKEKKNLFLLGTRLKPIYIRRLCHQLPTAITSWRRAVRRGGRADRRRLWHVSDKRNLNFPRPEWYNRLAKCLHVRLSGHPGAQLARKGVHQELLPNQRHQSVHLLSGRRK